MASQFSAEVAALPRVLPNLVYRDEMTFWSGRREHRLMSVTGDASASTVLYLPDARVLVTGDVLASPEDGKGPPPWTTSSFVVTPWVESLRRLDRLDVRAIVPGEGPRCATGRTSARIHPCSARHRPGARRARARGS